MEALAVVVAFILGYAFRGLIGHELKAVGEEIKNEIAVLRADIKAKI